MPSTYSNIKIQLMATGENNTTWGNVTNINLGTALEEAIVGSADVTFASGNVTLTLTDTNASQTARHVRLRCTGVTGGSTRDLIVPAIEKPYLVQNDCLNSIVVKNATGTGITVPAGKTMWVYNDGTNVVDAVNHLSSLTLGTALPVGQGGTGASTFTANGIIYGNTTSALLATAAGTTGQVLVGNTGGAPSWATLTGIGVTSFSGGTTGLTPASPTTGAITLAGTLGVANGGTGTATQFTAGSVVFAGASGVYSQDNANLFWDNANDRLGIGTATPDYQLHLGGQTVGAVTGSLALGDVAGTPSALVQGLRGGLGDFAGSLLLSTTTGAGSVTERMRIDSVGNVGIGTSSPATRLSVAGTVTVTDGTIDMSTGYSIRWGGAASGIYAGSGTQDMVFTVGSSERMRVNGASGNVGIGTASPGAKLDVRTSLSATTGVQNIADFYPITSGNTDATYGGRITLFTKNLNGNYWPAAIAALNDAGGSNLSSLGFYTATAGQTLNERMRIDSSGNVGIGTASPSARLDIDAGNLRFADGWGPVWGTGSNLPYISGSKASNFLQIGVNGSERMRITSAGNVGIGTSSPGARLEIAVTSAGATAEVLRLSNTAAGANTQAQINFEGNFTSYATIAGGYGAAAPQMTFNLPSATAGNYIWQISGTERMRIASDTAAVFNSTGDTYIQLQNSGTNALYIQSAASAAYLWNQLATPFLFGTSNTERMRITAGGAVGIGTSSPGATLDVNGAITANGPIYTYSGSGGTITAFDNNATRNNRIVIGADGNGAYVDSTFSTGGTGAITFKTRGADVVRIADITGYVGFGTNSPERIFQISQSVVGAETGAFITNTGSSAVNNAASIWFGTWTGASTNNIYNAKISAINVSAGSAATDLAMYTYNGSGAASGVIERMRITSAGNVGIGTSSPTALLDLKLASDARLLFQDGNTTNNAKINAVNNAVSTNTNLEIAANNTLFFNGGSERMRISDLGNLGLGAVPPTLGYGRQLTISQSVGTANPSLVHQAVNTNDERIYLTNNMAFGTSGFSATYTYIKTGCAATYYLQTGGQHSWYNAPTGTAGNTISFTQAMTLDFNGNLGIGTTTTTNGRLNVQAGTSATGNSAFFSVLDGTYNAYLQIQHSTAGIKLFNGNSFGAAANNLIFGNATTSETMRIDNAGNVGIGVTPSAWNADYKVLQVGASGSIAGRVGTSNTLDFTANGYRAVDGNWKYTTSQPSARFVVDGSVPGFQWYIAASGTAGNNITYTQAMTLDSLGNVGIGTASPSQRLDIVSSSGSPSYARMSDGTVTFLVGAQPVLSSALLGTTSNHPVQFWANNSERARVTAAGELLVGTTTAQTGVAGDAVGITLYGTTATGAAVFTRDSVNSVLYVNNKTSGGQLVQFYNGGNQVGSITSNGTTTAYVTTSDQRLKRDIVNAPEASSLIDAIKVRSFKWNADNSEQRYGFVAQELLTVAPEAVSVPADPDDMMGVDYSKLVPMLVKAIQELTARVAQLEGK